MSGTAQTTYDVAALATYGIVSPFAPNYAYNNYGGNVQQLLGQAPSFYGGNNQSTAYQIGYGTVTAATMLLGGEESEAGSLGEVSGASSVITDPARLLPAPQQPLALLPENAASLTEGSQELVPYYPPNQGVVAGTSGQATLIPGTVVDRFGGTGGSFLSPQGTPSWARSLPYGAENNPLNTYQVMQPIEVNAGTAAPWFNQPGGGIQYDLGTRTVQDLINSGHLAPIQP